MVWTEDQKTHGVMEKWVSWWPEIKLIREGRVEDVVSKLDSQKYIRYGSSIKLREDCDGWACTAVEAAMEKQVTPPEYIGIALVSDLQGQKENRKVNHAIAIFSLDNGKSWVTIDSQTRYIVSATYMGHKYYSIMLMNKPGEWSRDFSIS